MEKVLVTGSTDGIGQQIALRLAGLGYYVIIHGRDREKCLRVYYQIKKYVPTDQVDFLIADFSELKEVKAFAEKLIGRHPDLNVLINNAGAPYFKYQLNAEGIEKNFALNYLSRFLLTNLLINAEQIRGLSRVIEVAGASHKKGEINFEDVNQSRKFSYIKALRQAKLADVLFTYKLARQQEENGVLVNCLHPGKVKTSAILRAPNTPFFIKWFYKFTRRFFKSPYKGSDTAIYLAHADELNGVTGKYFINKKPAKSSKKSYDTELQDKLWELSMEMSGLEEHTKSS